MVGISEYQETFLGQHSSKARELRSKEWAELMKRWQYDAPTPWLIAEPCRITLKTVVTVRRHLSGSNT